MTEIVINKENKDKTVLQEVHSGDAFEEFLQSKKLLPREKGSLIWEPTISVPQLVTY